MGRVEGKAAIVTGGALGIGKACCLRLVLGCRSSRYIRSFVGQACPQDCLTKRVGNLRNLKVTDTTSKHGFLTAGR